MPSYPPLLRAPSYLLLMWVADLAGEALTRLAGREEAQTSPHGLVWRTAPAGRGDPPCQAGRIKPRKATFRVPPLPPTLLPRVPPPPTPCSPSPGRRRLSIHACGGSARRPIGLQPHRQTKQKNDKRNKKNNRKKKKKKNYIRNAFQPDCPALGTAGSGAS